MPRPRGPCQGLVLAPWSSLTWRLQTLSSWNTKTSNWHWALDYYVSPIKIIKGMPIMYRIGTNVSWVIKNYRYVGYVSVCTRLGIAYAVGIVSWFMKNLGKAHWDCEVDTKVSQRNFYTRLMLWKRWSCIVGLYRFKLCWWKGSHEVHIWIPDDLCRGSSVMTIKIA